VGGQSNTGGRVEGNSGIGGDGSGEKAGAGGAPSHAVTFTIPEEGGEVDVALPNGESVNFEFPASAAGRTVILTPTDGSAIGWGATEFPHVIALSPHGAEFEEPVIVRPSNRAVTMLHFTSEGQKTRPEILTGNPDGDGLELYHFSALAQFPKGSCVSDVIWDLSPDCPPSLFFTTYIHQSCKTMDGCFETSASCCVRPGETTCGLGEGRFELAEETTDAAACSGEEEPDCVSNFDCTRTDAECGSVIDNCGDSHDVASECEGIPGCGQLGTCERNSCGPCTPYASCDEATAASGVCNGLVPDGCGHTLECEPTACDAGEQCMQVGKGYFSCKQPCTTNSDCPIFVPQCVDESTVTIGGWFCGDKNFCERR
jgi:hypothetical protein